MGEMFSKVCVMVAFGYLARVLTPASYGIIEQSLAITVFFVLFVESGMGLYGARTVAASSERIPTLVARVMALRVLLGVPAFAVILGVAFYYRMTGLGILAVNGIAILLTPFLTQWVFQGLRQMSWVAGGTAARNLTFVALVFALVGPGSDLWLVAAAEVSGILVLALVNAWFLHGRLGVRLDTNGVAAGARTLFGDVWFMGVSDLMWACLWYSPAVIVGWMSVNGPEEVAWVGSGVRIVLAVYVFVFLYFYNLLPDLATELAVGRDRWRSLMQRSIATSLWPACLVAIGGTLFAPVLIPAIYSGVFQPAVVPFQIAIWMIPAASFNGHFRFSLVAAGKQWWEFVAAVATAAVTLLAAVLLSRRYGSVGATTALVTGGFTNTVLSMAFSHQQLGAIRLWPSAGPPLLATTVAMVVGVAVSSLAGPWAGTVAACLLFVALALRHQKDLVKPFRDWSGGLR